MRIAGGWQSQSFHETPVERFQLIEALSPGGNALAYIRRYNRATEQFETTEETFHVHDPDYAFVGDGEDETHYGERGRAVYMPDSMLHEIIQMQCRNQRLTK